MEMEQNRRSSEFLIEQQAQSELGCPESLQDQLLSSQKNNNKINKRHCRRYEQRKENHVSIREQFIKSRVLRFGA